MIDGSLAPCSEEAGSTWADLEWIKLAYEHDFREISSL